MQELQHGTSYGTKRKTKRENRKGKHVGFTPQVAFQRKLESKPHDYVFLIVNIHCDVMKRIAKAAMRLEAVRVAHIFKRIKEDEDLLRWHNEMWHTNI